MPKKNHAKTNNISQSQFPQFDKYDIKELDSLRRKTIDDFYNLELNEFQKESLSMVIKDCEKNMIRINYCFTMFAKIIFTQIFNTIITI